MTIRDMKILSIDVQNFKSIEHMHIDFGDVRGFWEIQGNVGSGKTSVGESILFGLFGSVRGKNNGDLVRWGEKKCTIAMSCMCKGKRIDINRTISNKGSSTLLAKCDGDNIVFTNKRNAQQILETQYFDVPRIVLEQLCIISFNDFRSLSTLNASDKKRFLDQVFGFCLLTDYGNLCKDMRSECVVEKRYTESDKTVILNDIERLEELRKVDRVVTEEDITDMERRIDEKRDEYSSFHNETLAVINRSQTRRNKLSQQLGHIKGDGVRLKKDIEFLKKGICPTCGAPLDQTHLHEYEEQRAALLEKYNEINDKINTIDEELKEYTDVRESTSKGMLDEWEAMKDELNEMRYALKASQDTSVEMDKYHEDVKVINDKIDRLEHDIKCWDELYGYINVTLRNDIMGSIIPHINKYIDEYMRQLHQPYIVKFDSNFDCHIYILGRRDPISVTNLSTGQMKIVDMVTILSILKVIMNSVNFNIWFLDELLSNMDEEMRDLMCGILKSSMDPGHSIFIISHAKLSEFAIDGCIEVNNRDNNSQYTIKIMN